VDFEMGLALPLLGLGIGLLAVGFYYQIIERGLDIISWMIIPSEYYTLSETFWDMIPWIAIILGVVCLIASGVMHRASKQVVYE